MKIIRKIEENKSPVIQNSDISIPIETDKNAKTEALILKRADPMSAEKKR
jgi:hypothetical protein